MAGTRRVSGEELERIARFVQSYCDSELSRRVATMPGTRPERPFAFEHDGVLLHGRLDVLQLDSDRARRHRLQDELAGRGDARGDRRARLRSAATRLRPRVLPRGRRGGRGRLPLPRAIRRGRLDGVPGRRAPELEAELSAAIAKINAGEFRPTPSEYICAGCPALDVVCAGPRLRSAAYAEQSLATV